ncbi:MAG: VWA domain-containing protein [Rhodomicrobium sp.]|nr:VWA domain-containing protein [Rhodomicrobium sp.]
MKRWIGALVLALMAMTLANCGEDTASELTVLAGSELKDIEPLIPDIKRATGVELKLTYTGTLDGAEKIIGGDPSDAAWFSHNKYLALLQGASRKILAQEKIALSPVIIGVKESVARQWGWTDKAPSWRDIAQKAASGELRFAMTNPASSNTGFSALVAITVAFANRGDAITAADIENSVITDFFKGQKLASGSSGWLAESYAGSQDQLNGIVNYESVLMQLNEGGQLREKLVLIYPSEGVISADYPLMLLNETKREAYTKVVDYLRTPEVQTRIMNETQRRPVIPQVKPSAAFGDRLLIELPFPDRQEIVDRILFAYLDQHRRPAHVYFVLDVSGSMAGERLDGLRTAMYNLAGQDRSLTGQFVRFASREKVTVITFSNAVNDVERFEIAGPVDQAPAIARIKSLIANLEAAGGTAIYSALQRAYELAAKDYDAEPDRYYSIVLLTDGENNQGISPDRFISFYTSLPPEVRATKVFPVLFGSASEAEMKELAEMSAGRLFDGKKSLAGAFKSIRGYQ